MDLDRIRLPRARSCVALLCIGAVLSLSGLLACGLTACGSFVGPTDRRMSFAQMQAINPGVSGDWVLYEHPYARDVTRDPQSQTVRRLSYWVADPQGDSRPLMLHFDERGVLSRKNYGGPIIRPPVDEELEFDEDAPTNTTSPNTAPSAG